MSIQTRRERERAERERLIVTAARELAENEGWEAVTTRRLAAEIEYSQPVLYSHFKGKEAIMKAVALQGIADLGAEMHAARTALTGDENTPQAALQAVGVAYTAFGLQRPALYDAMFTHAVDLPFASPEAPAALHDAFGELEAVVTPFTAQDEHPGPLTETYWAALHGLVTLTRSGRVPAEYHELRLASLFRRFTPPS